MQALVSRVTDRRVITYGFNAQADVRAENLYYENGGAKFDVIFRSREAGNEVRWDGLFLPMAGDHNTQNALAAIAVARALDLTEEQVRKGLAEFAGVKRRFSDAGQWNGVQIIDDYGHHPVEISAVLKAATQVCAGKVHAVVQPHRYSRLEDLFEEFCTCFNDASAVYVTDVYEAGEQLLLRALAARDLVEGLARHGHRNAQSVTRENIAAHPKTKS